MSEDNPTDDFEYVQTKISQSNWCTFDISRKASFEAARISKFNTDPSSKDGQKSNEMNCFDLLFYDRIKIPAKRTAGDKQKTKPVTFLIMGPPGSGKTTLALELCYRLANSHEGPDLKSLYISLETDTDQLFSKIESYGWENWRDRFCKFNRNEIRSPNTRNVTLWGRDQIRDGNNNIVDIVEVALLTICGALKFPQFGNANLLTKPINWLSRKISELIWAKKMGSFRKDILIIDSLNIVRPDKRDNLLDQYQKLASDKVRMVIFIMDAQSENTHHYWEFVCDNVIRLEANSIHDYYVRMIEIVKTRFQDHIHGKHQLKIYDKPGELPDGDMDSRNTLMRRMHPYRKEGGIFIYPSIHYYLSRYKRRSPDPETELGRVKTYPKNLNDVSSFPKGRCTAFIGDRGTHKSHLAYLNLLQHLMKDEGSEIIDPKSSGLLITLRDDEDMCKQSLTRILETEFRLTYNEAQIQLEKWESQNRLEIIYYFPGYITPEEVYHRMFLSIHRLKEHHPDFFAIFNSLDQIAARFPLCAKQEIFIPGIIETLCGERCTSIFIAVEEPGQPGEQYGLLPLSDLVLSFKRSKFPGDSYYTHLKNHMEQRLDSNINSEKLEVLKDQLTNRDSVVIEVKRLFGGRKPGAKGILELVERVEDLSSNGGLVASVKEPFERPGMHFVPLSPMVDQGNP